MPRLDRIHESFRLNSLKEGGLHSVEDMISMADGKAVVVIGLGGSGKDAVVRVKTELTKRIKNREHIAYLVIDTADSGINGENTPDAELLTNQEILLFPNAQQMAGLVAGAANLPEHEREWLNPHLTIPPAEPGAAQMRQVGRLNFIHDFDAVYRKIDGAFTRALGPLPQLATEFMIFVISGISGGTGAGTFLDTLFVLRQFCNNKQYSVAKIYSYLFTPDVNISDDMTAEKKDGARCNGFASFKELDYWLNIEYNKADFYQKYSNTFIVNTKTWGVPRLVDNCFLVSGSTIEGARPENHYDYAMRVVAENIITMISPDANGAFSISLDLSNMPNHIKEKLQKGVKYAVNRPYIAIGAVQKTSCKNAILNTIMERLLKRISGTFDNTPAADVNIVSTNANSLYSQNSKRTQLTENKLREKASRDDFIKGRIAPETIAKNSVDSCIESWEKALDNEINKKYEEIKKTVLNAFKDMTKGPYYAHKLLYNVALPFISFQMSEADRPERNASDELNGRDGMPGIIQNVEEKKAYATQHSRLGYGDYIRETIKLYQAYHDQKLYGLVHDKLNDLYRKVNDLNSNLVESWFAVLRNMSEVFNNNLDILTNVTVNQNGNVTNYIWDDTNYETIQGSVDQVLGVYGDQQQDRIAESLLTALIDLAQVPDFIRDPDPDVLNNKVVKIIEERFKDLVNQSMEARLASDIGVNYYPNGGIAGNSEFIDALVKDEIQKMVDQSKPMFPVNRQQFDIDSEAIKVIEIHYPSNAPCICKAVTDYLTQNQGSGIFGVPKSDQTRIVVKSYYGGIPAYAYHHVLDCANAYHAAGTTLDSKGVHLRMSEAENWIKYPDSLPESVWSSLGGTIPDTESRRIRHSDDVIQQLWDNDLFFIVGGGDDGNGDGNGANAGAANGTYVYLRTNVSESDAERLGARAWNGKNGAWGDCTIDAAINNRNNPNYPLKVIVMPLINCMVSVENPQHELFNFHHTASAAELAQNNLTKKDVLLKTIKANAAQYPGLIEKCEEALSIYRESLAVRNFVYAYALGFLNDEDENGQYMFIFNRRTEAILTRGARDYRYDSELWQKKNLLPELAYALKIHYKEHVDVLAAVNEKINDDRRKLGAHDPGTTEAYKVVIERLNMLANKARNAIETIERDYENPLISQGDCIDVLKRIIAKCSSEGSRLKQYLPDDPEPIPESAPIPKPTQTWTCRHCGKEGNDGAFCGNCGRPRPKEQDTRATWTCRHCGKEGNDGAFCTGCGRPRPKEQDTQAAWTCRHCGREENDGAFCAGCGRPKEQDAQATWTCRHCGKEGNDGAFCAGCGDPRD